MLLVSEITVPISSVLPPPSKTGCRFQALKLHCLCLVSLFQRPQPNYLHLVVVVADAQGPGDARLSPPSSFFSPRREPSEDRRSLLAAAECPSCAAGEVRPALRGHRCRSASQFPSPCRRCRRVLSSPLLPELVASQQELRHSSLHVTTSAALARARERSSVDLCSLLFFLPLVLLVAAQLALDAAPRKGAGEELEHVVARDHGPQRHALEDGTRRKCCEAKLAASELESEFESESELAILAAAPVVVVVVVLPPLPQPSSSASSSSSEAR